ncbi:hypothetical protein SISSUDRAFT_289168 [Sistotremastrum suecicum HHB10207 ss-3]|uniref:Uncharacterized protein n=1 Tax=Sistotremastrum suecicum HHB10207 ss-3 TaxID=1314776 RepID=A0A165ZKD0_9AGAM|nr:hypothetical protein SISSUDRAFT_289168 [Sistotremastrum suecicum HHB10207 ss-3]
MDSVDPEAQQLGSVAPNAEGAFIRSQWIFTVLQVLGGQIALPVLLATFICVKGLRRNFVIKSFCLTWIISSISYCLELYAFHFVLPESRSDDILEPSTDIFCLNQAALINGCITMTSVATLGVVLDLWLIIRIPRLGTGIKRSLLLSTPAYISFLVFYVKTAIPCQSVRLTDHVIGRSSLQ